MGMAIGNGVGTPSVKEYNSRRYSSGTKTRKAVRKSSTKKKKTKKLNYNFKEISTKLLQTKTSGTASRVMVLARSRAALLRMKLASSDYNRGELTSAILHADAMVRAAKKRMKHLKMEEQAKQDGIPPVEEAQEREAVLDLTAFSDDGGKLAEEMQDLSREMAQELARELQRIMEETMEETIQQASRAMEDALQMDELSEELAGAVDEMEPADLEQLKKKHRADELREIMEADMKYLKALFDRLAKEQRESSALSGLGGDSQADGQAERYVPDMAAATVEIGGADMQVLDAVVMGDGTGGSVDIAL